MQVDWYKVRIYAGVLAIAAWGLGIKYVIDHQPPRPEPPVSTTPPVIVAPPAKPVEKKAPVEKPAPAPKKVVKPAPRPKSHYTPKPLDLSPSCTSVPAEAYKHPPDVVVAVAKRRGVSGEDLSTLKRCIGA